jgi:hypothetical protein
VGTVLLWPAVLLARKGSIQISQYLRHLADDVLPIILRTVFESASVSTSKWITVYLGALSALREQR